MAGPGYPSELEQEVLENSDYVRALQDVMEKAKSVLKGRDQRRARIELDEAIKEAEILQ
jgi:hypothetical protein